MAAAAMASGACGSGAAPNDAQPLSSLEGVEPSFLTVPPPPTAATTTTTSTTTTTATTTSTTTTTQPPTDEPSAPGADNTNDDAEGGVDNASAADCPTTYVIQAGDTTRIGVAERFGISFETMDAANAETPGYDSFVVGTEITIPCPAGSGAGSAP